MADAAVLGTAYTRVNDSLSPAVSIADVPVGAWVIVSLMSASSTATFTAPAGWEVLKAAMGSEARRSIATSTAIKRPRLMPMRIARAASADTLIVNPCTRCGSSRTPAARCRTLTRH